VFAEHSRKRWLLIALAFVAALVSALLERVHYRAHALAAASSFCSLGQHFDCASVALSRYSVWLGVPVPLWGVVGFGAIGVAAWRRSPWLLPLAALSLVASLGLLLVELVFVRSVCLLCEVVHVACVALCLVAWRGRRREPPPPFTLSDTSAVLAPAAGVLLALGLFLPRYWGAFDWREALPFAQGTTEEGDAWVGAAEPKLTVIEFVDYTCPHCRAASNRTWRALTRHADELRVVRAFFPRIACDGKRGGNCLPVRIALCAGEQAKFWQADRYLFEHVTWDKELDPARVAEELALARDPFSACLDRPDVVARAAGAWKRAKKLRLPGTPYYLVDGKKRSESEVARAIDAL
jgi:uncharacterized membrane protein